MSHDSNSTEKFDHANVRSRQDSNGNALHGSISLTPEMFEKMYFSPQNQVKGDLRKTFGNPTPLQAHFLQLYFNHILIARIRAVLGLVMSLTPLSCDLMGWRGAGGNGAASIGVYYFMGGLLMILGGVFEFLLGNTFPFVLFGGYGSFWLSYGATLQPFYSAYASYSPDANDPAMGLKTTGFNASFAFYLGFMGIFSFACTLCALKTNVALVGVEFCLTLSFSLLAGAFFQSAQGGSNAASLQIAGGAFGFVASLCGWYLFFALMFSSVELPFPLPVGDLSGMFGRFESKNKVRDDRAV